MSSLCIIPARGGSKRIPHKNIKDFLGKPIIAYSIEAAVESGLFEEIMVSTDDKEIAEISKEYGAAVPFFRGNENAGDFAGITEVLIEVIEQYKFDGKTFDFVCCILPTAPFVSAERLCQAMKMLSSEKYNCIFSVTEFAYSIYRSLKEKNGFFTMNWPENFPKRSQDLPTSYHDAGQFYFLTVKDLFSERKLFTSKSGCIVLNNLEVQDIDTKTDWTLAEMKYKMYLEK